MRIAYCTKGSKCKLHLISNISQKFYVYFEKNLWVAASIIIRMKSIERFATCNTKMPESEMHFSVKKKKSPLNAFTFDLFIFALIEIKCCILNFFYIFYSFYY